jgi:hypothetical protein
MALNRWLPEITAHDVLPIAPFGNYSAASLANNPARLETFPGAARLTRFPLSRAGTKIVRFFRQVPKRFLSER